VINISFNIDGKMGLKKKYNTSRTLLLHTSLNIVQMDKWHVTKERVSYGMDSFV
jgi:hypothetical protein